VNHRAALELSATAFAIRFLPPAVGTFSTLALVAVFGEVARLTPYITMASTRESPSGSRAFRSIFVSYFPYGVVGGTSRLHHYTLSTLKWALFVFQLFVTPLKSILFTQRSPTSNGVPGTPSERVLLADVVAIILIIIYSIAVLSLCFTVLRLWNKETGLRWNVDSIADMIVLLRHSNALAPFCNLDWKHLSRGQFYNLLKDQHLRLGYWKTADGKYVHTIGTQDQGK